MADEIVITHDDTETEPETTIVPVIVPDNSASVELAYAAGANDARLAQLELENAELRARLDAAQATADTALDVAITATATAEVAAEVAADAALPDEPIEMSEPEPDHKPTKQHFMFREKDEWHR